MAILIIVIFQAEGSYWNPDPVINPDTVYVGLLDPSNISIHVGQNFVNFFAGTIAWILLMHVYTPDFEAGRRFNPDYNNRVKRSSNDDTKKLRMTEELARILKLAAETAEGLDNIIKQYT